MKTTLTLSDTADEETKPMVLGLAETILITSLSFSNSLGGVPFPVKISFDQYAFNWLEVLLSNLLLNCSVAALLDS